MSLVKPLAAAINKSTASSLTGLIGTDSGTSEVVPTPVNLIPEVDFTQWKQSGVYGMTEVTENSFTNKATSSVAFDIGAEAGETYLVSFTMDRGAGALRVYISEEGTITTNDDVHDVTTGDTFIEVVASGPWFTFRASVGNTTTTVSNLKVYKKAKSKPVDIDAQVQALRSELFSNSENGVFYVPKPVVQGKQVLFQDSSGLIPVKTSGDPVGLMLDVSKGITGDELFGDANLGNPLNWQFTDESEWDLSVEGQFSITDAASRNDASPTQPPTVVEGVNYQVLVEYTNVSGPVRIYYPNANSFALPEGSGTSTFIVKAGDLKYFSISAREGSTATIKYLGIRELFGAYVYQDNSVSRPTYQTDGTLHWLNFDGVDDYLEDPTGLEIEGEEPSYISVCGKANSSMDNNDGFYSYSNGELQTGSARAIDFGSNTSLKVDSISTGVSIVIPNAAIIPAVYEGLFGEGVRGGFNGNEWKGPVGTVNTSISPSVVGRGVLSSGYTSCRIYGLVHYLSDVGSSDRQNTVDILSSFGGI